MSISITPVAINDGDPVTAAALQTIISNVQKVAAGDTSTIVPVINTSTGGGTGSGAVLTTTLGGSVAGRPLKATSNTTYKITFANKFATIPTVNLTLQVNSADRLKAKYIPVLLDVQLDHFTYAFIPISSSSSTSTGTLHWIANGTLSPTTN